MNALKKLLGLGTRELEAKAAAVYTYDRYLDSVDNGLLEGRVNHVADEAAKDLVGILIRWKDAETSLTNIALNHEIGRVRDAAGSRLAKSLTEAQKDQNVLCRLARESRIIPVRCAAVAKLLDAVALSQALADADHHVRESAAEALGKLGDAQAVEPLCKALADADHHVRKSAAEALVKVGDARAVEPLCMALCDAYTLVRVYAAEALGRIGDTRAVIPLRKALGDKDVWSAATQALDKISGLQSASGLD